MALHTFKQDLQRGSTHHGVALQAMLRPFKGAQHSGLPSGKHTHCASCDCAVHWPVHASTMICDFITSAHTSVKHVDSLILPAHVACCTMPPGWSLLFPVICNGAVCCITLLHNAIQHICCHKEHVQATFCLALMLTRAWCFCAAFRGVRPCHWPLDVCGKHAHVARRLRGGTCV